MHTVDDDMRGKKESFSLEGFALILVDLKFEKDRIIKQFNDLSKEIETRDDKSSNTRFLEYLIFDLFTDYSCFVLAFSREISRMLFETYSLNILVRLLGKGYKVDPQEFEGLFNERATEYHQYLQEYDPEYMKKIDTNKYVPSLGKAFSMNFVGWEDPRIIYAAHWMFVWKLKHIIKYLKDVAEKYEIVLQK
jgi:hypothetical protein